ncbi:helitron helicase-like domain-containing protein [Artemisia annua]|uniref:Helitron helicase-like domain-containing protein n=1 Tax=Artemisia annua TaxID=35608 RepID=A0A2U1NZ30_ARTAN|nr:helitron helicase-like domain-containing protein [Artemisia annua]
MNYTLKNDAQKIGNQLLQNPQTNNTINVHGSTRHPTYRSSSSISAAVSSTSASTSTFSCGKPYLGPVMLDFVSQTVRRAPYEYSDLNKRNSTTTKAQLYPWEATPINQTPPPLANVFSSQRLKRSNLRTDPDTCTRKRRRKARNSNKDADTGTIEPVIQPCLDSNPNTGVAANQSALFQALPQSSEAATVHHSGSHHSLTNEGGQHFMQRNVGCTNLQSCVGNKCSPVVTKFMGDAIKSGTRPSEATESSHINKKRCLNQLSKDKQIAPDLTTCSIQRRSSPSGFQSASANDVYNCTQEPDNHANNKTLDCNTSNDRCFKRQWKNNQPVTDVNKRCVKQRLSSTGLQSSSSNNVYDTSQEPQNDATEGTNESPVYEDLGDCNERCRYCNAAFWHEERLKGHREAKYHLCCGGDKHIRVYNQMFAMTSFGMNIDNTVNQGRGPYVFKVSGQVYHQIGSLCPTGDDKPYILQLYIYDTQNEVQNRMCHFTNSDTSALDPEVVQGLIEFLDTHNELVQVFRTARDKCAENDVPEFKVLLYNGSGARGYELPTSQAIGAIVFGSGPTTKTNYDIIIEYRDGPAKGINKLHQSYMSLQFPLIFIYRQPGYHIKLMLRSADPNERSSGFQ